MRVTPCPHHLALQTRPCSAFRPSRAKNWLNRNRRLAKDFEAGIESAVMFYVASVKPMSGRLAAR